LKDFILTLNKIVFPDIKTSEVKFNETIG
jgi:hypothetical protein